MIKYFKINWILFKNSYIRDSKVPGFVIVNIITQLFDTGVSVIFFNVIFANTKSLAGWNFYQVLFLFFFAKTILIFHNLWTRAGIKSMATNLIRQGEYDFYLTKPVDSMFMVSISKPRIYGIVSGVVNISLMVYVALKSNIDIGWINIFWFLVLGIVGFVLYYFLQILTIVPAFWFIRLWSLQDLIIRMNQFMRYPAGIFPTSIKFVLLTLFPILAVSYIPAQTLFYPPRIEYIIYMILITVFFGFLVRLLWKTGEKRYGSASS